MCSFLHIQYFRKTYLDECGATATGNNYMPTSKDLLILNHQTKAVWCKKTRQDSSASYLQLVIEVAFFERRELQTFCTALT